MWVFGYGSLMWKTEFDFIKKEKVILNNYERDFCINTSINRGNSDFKGLVLGITYKEEAECIGIAYKIADDNIEKVKEYLKIREMSEDYYIEKFLDITINGKKEKALTYICNQNSKLYKNNLSNNDKAYIIKKCRRDLWKKY